MVTLKEFVINENGVGGFNFHTFLLSALFGPGDGADMQRAINTLQQMAHRASGIFMEFQNAEAIDFVNVTDMRLTAEYTIQFALAFNQNVKPGINLVHVDSDGDWLIDAEEISKYTLYFLDCSSLTLPRLTML